MDARECHFAISRRKPLPIVRVHVGFGTDWFSARYLELFEQGGVTFTQKSRNQYVFKKDPTFDTYEQCSSEQS